MGYLLLADEAKYGLYLVSYENKLILLLLLLFICKFRFGSPVHAGSFHTLRNHSHNAHLDPDPQIHCSLFFRFSHNYADMP